MSLALYRTYRPGKFADVIGQDHVTEPLKRALASDRTHHAYLFSGPRGCGKTSSARILARSLNCANGPTAEPCGTCPSCIDLAPNGNGSLDVIELDAASNRGIDQARELREQAMYAPAGSRFRIYIIDEAHQLTTEAANALLKLVEEPPAHLRFIFATTEPEKLLSTIRSRTHHYPFRLVPTSILQEHLAKVCEAENVSADPAALALAAKAGAGSVRDALSVLGQLVGGAGKDGITYEDAVTQLGFTSDSLIDDVINSLLNEDGATLFKVIDSVVSSGHDPRRFATDLLERLRDLIILNAAPEAAEHGLIHQPADRIETLKQQANALGGAALTRAAEIVSNGITALRGATTPRLHLELLASRLLVNSKESDSAAILARLDGLERKIAQGIAVAATNAPAVAPAPAAKSSPPPKLSDIAPATKTATKKEIKTESAAEPAKPEVAEEAVVTEISSEESPVTAAAEISLESLKGLWTTVLNTLRDMEGGGRVAWSVAVAGYPTAVAGDAVTITFGNVGPIDIAKKRGVDKLLVQAVELVFGKKVSVALEHVEGFTAPEPNTSAPDISPKPVAKAQPVVTEVAAEDVPDEEIVSEDDPVLDLATGTELVQKMFGGKVIEEYDEKKKR
ncbi:MAG: polymerase subunit gamma and tau [Actinomycetota bacterium]